MGALMSMAAGNIAAASARNPTYSITNPIGNQVNEGTAWDFFITTTNVNPGTNLYWSIDYGSSNNSTSVADFAAVNGSLVLNSDPNRNQFVVFFNADSTTEGPETFRVEIRTDSNTGPIVVVSDPIRINDTSTGAGTTTTTSAPPVYYVSNPVGNQVDEGIVYYFSVTGNNVPNGTSLYWTIDYNSSTNANDFFITNGSVLLPNNNQFAVDFTSDSLTEGPQTFKVDIRTGSNTGPIVVSSDLITINDTSTGTTTTTTTPAPSGITYSIFPYDRNVYEGATIPFTLERMYGSGVMFWTLDYNSSSSNTDFFPLDSGSINFTGTLGYFNVSIKTDALTEGQESFKVQIRENSYTGPIVLTTDTIYINDPGATTTTPAPYSYEFVSLSNTINEGANVTYTVQTNAPIGTRLYAFFNDITVNELDFVGAGGLFFVLNTVGGYNTGTFTVEPKADSTTEGSETFTISIATAGPMSNTGYGPGYTVLTSNVITIIDTST